MSDVIRPEVKVFFDPVTNTVTSIVKDPNSEHVAIIDSVMGFDYASGRTERALADELIAYVEAQRLKVDWILETHAHADHLSAAPYLKRKLGGKVAIGADIQTIQGVFGELFNEGADFLRDGSQFDHLFVDGERFMIGGMEATVMHTPGHTPACVSYHIGDALFVGDTLFMPDFGTARCDFPGGSAEQLFDSVGRILELPAETRMFVGHDYKAQGRDEYAWETTVGAQREANVHVGAGRSREGFVEMRQRRDATLSMPKLIVPAIQVNIRAGNMPEPDGAGRVFLKVPVDAL